MLAWSFLFKLFENCFWKRIDFFHDVILGLDIFFLCKILDDSFKLLSVGVLCHLLDFRHSSFNTIFRFDCWFPFEDFSIWVPSSFVLKLDHFPFRKMNERLVLVIICLYLVSMHKPFWKSIYEYFKHLF